MHQRLGVGLLKILKELTKNINLIHIQLIESCLRLNKMNFHSVKLINRELFNKLLVKTKFPINIALVKITLLRLQLKFCN